MTASAPGDVARARPWHPIMPPAVLYLKQHLATADRRRLGAVAILAALQLAAAGLLIWSEADLAARAAFVLTWACSISSGWSCCGGR